MKLNLADHSPLKNSNLKKMKFLMAPNLEVVEVKIILQLIQVVLILEEEEVQVSQIMEMMIRVEKEMLRAQRSNQRKAEVLAVVANNLNSNNLQALDSLRRIMIALIEKLNIAQIKIQDLLLMKAQVSKSRKIKINLSHKLINLLLDGIMILTYLPALNLPLMLALVQLVVIRVHPTLVLVVLNSLNQLVKRISHLLQV